VRGLATARRLVVFTHLSFSEPSDPRAEKECV
jgi:hypothetical protein